MTHDSTIHDFPGPRESGAPPSFPDEGPSRADRSSAEVTHPDEGLSSADRSSAEATHPDERDSPGQQVGVGPHPEPWPDDPRLDPDLLAHGDRRNVVDQFRYWRLEEIVAELDRHRHGLHVAIQNWEHDFNIGSIVRTANGFNAAGVHIVGRRRWNRRGAMVTDRYLHVHHHPDEAALQQWMAERDIPLVGVDNLPGSVPLETSVLPRSVCLVFGSEGPGLTEAMVAACTQLVSITQYGSTRSLNAGAAAAITMYHWALQHAAAGNPGRSGSPAH